MLQEGCSIHRCRRNRLLGSSRRPALWTMAVARASCTTRSDSAALGLDAIRESKPPPPSGRGHRSATASPSSPKKYRRARLKISRSLVTGVCVLRASWPRQVRARRGQSSYRQGLMTGVTWLIWLYFCRNHHRFSSMRVGTPLNLFRPDGGGGIGAAVLSDTPPPVRQSGFVPDRPATGTPPPPPPLARSVCWSARCGWTLAHKKRVVRQSASMPPPEFSMKAATRAFEARVRW